MTDSEANSSDVAAPVWLPELTSLVRDGIEFSTKAPAPTAIEAQLLNEDDQWMVRDLRPALSDVEKHRGLVDFVADESAGLIADWDGAGASVVEGAVSDGAVWIALPSPAAAG